LVLVERQVEFVVRCVGKMQRERLRSMEVKREAVGDYDAYLRVSGFASVWFDVGLSGGGAFRRIFQRWAGHDSVRFGACVLSGVECRPCIRTSATRGTGAPTAPSQGCGPVSIASHPPSYSPHFSPSQAPASTASSPSPTPAGKTSTTNFSTPTGRQTGSSGSATARRRTRSI
jgi:hypothetical protein